MIMDDEISNAGEVIAVARSALVNRRSFLLGSAAGLGALGLGGCATTDGMSLAEATATGEISGTPSC